MPQAPSVARGLPFVEGTVTAWPLKRLAGESAGGQYPAETAGKPASLGFLTQRVAGPKRLDKARTREI